MHMRLDRIIAVRNNKTVYRDGDRCLKVFAQTYTASQVLREAQILASVDEAGLPVPRLLSVTLWEGKWTIITEYVQGMALNRRMAENPDESLLYIADLIQVQKRIHSVRCPSLPSLADVCGNAVHCAQLPEDTKEFLYRRLAECPLTGDTVCHGELEPTNIIGNGTDYRVLDWSYATCGCSTADAACTYLLLYQSNGRDIAESYLTMYARENKISCDTVRQYLPLAAVLRYTRSNADNRAFLAPWLLKKRDSEP